MIIGIKAQITMNARRISVTQSLPDSQTGKLQPDRKEEGEGGLCAGTAFFWLLLPISLAQVCLCLSWACID